VHFQYTVKILPGGTFLGRSTLSTPFELSLAGIELSRAVWQWASARGQLWAGWLVF